MNITIGHLYPDLLNLYGDRGNIQCLKKRCEWRGIRAEVKEFRSGDKVDFQDLDIVLLGGGSAAISFLENITRPTTGSSRAWSWWISIPSRRKAV